MTEFEITLWAATVGSVFSVLGTLVTLWITRRQERRQQVRQEKNRTEVFQRYNERLQATRQEIISEAIRMLQEDIQNPQLNSTEALPDAFMLRANEVGRALLLNGFYAVAEKLYRMLADVTTRYRQTTNNWRHAGALFANIATACVAQGSIDRAIVELLKASNEDIQTYNIAPQDSFAITGLLQDYFARPTREFALGVVQQLDPNITFTDVESLCQFLGQREYAFLAYLHTVSLHEIANRQSTNEFSQLQIFNALRSLSALLEVELKLISGVMEAGLFDTLRNLYGNTSWWSGFDDTRKKIGATQKSSRSVDDQLRDAMAINPTNDVSTFWKSLLIAYIARNYTTHQLEIQSALVQSYSLETLRHILYVMITAQISTSH